MVLPKDTEDFHTQDVEKAVLGFLMGFSKDKSVAYEACSAREFYTPIHEQIFCICQDLWKNGHPVDVITVAERIGSDYKFDNFGGPAYLHELVNFAATEGQIEFYAKILRERRALRDLRSAGLAIQQMAELDTEFDAEATIAAAQAEVLKVTLDTPTEIDSAQAVTQTIANIKPHDAIPFPWDSINDLIVGALPEKLYILAARPSMGKSAAAVDITKHACMAGKRVLMFSLEMSRDEVYRRFLASMAEVNISRINRGSLYPKEWERINEAAEKIGQWALFLDDTHGSTMTRIKAAVQRSFRDGKPDMIVIDYLQIIRNPGKNVDRRVAVDEIAEFCKILAHDFNVPVITFAQLNRDAENKFPTLRDLRESGGIENAADVVILMHREDRSDTRLDMRVEKCRYDATGSASFYFDGAHSRILAQAPYREPVAQTGWHERAYAQDRLG